MGVCNESVVVMGDNKVTSGVIGDEKVRSLHKVPVNFISVVIVPL